MTTPADPIADGLRRVLAAEHQAVFGYPVLGVHLVDEARRERARALEAAHRSNRDAVADQLTSRHADPVAAAPGYPPPTPVTDPAAAAGWAVRIEETSAAAYRYLIGCAVRAGGSQQAVRRQALAGLSAAALAAAYWRGLTTPDRPTTPFPGTS
ncbi:MAG: ferritin-like domain-containing protein [Jatrophihabitantaceae bacterium]